MKLVVTNRASKWLQQTGISSGSQVALWAERQAGRFTINYRVQRPDQPVFTVSQDGLDFYVEFAEEWFFSGKQVTIDYQGGGRLTYQAVKEPVTAAAGSEQAPAAAPADASTAASRKYEEYWE